MIGQVVGHYKVVRKIGDGGMGSVFEAVHESIGRRVAIKVLRKEYSKEANLVARFFNEARAVNIVSHAGIVGSFDYGQLPDGTAYIVMEFVEGESLAGRIKRVKVGLGPDSLRIARQIAATLAAAHAKGIIHRDLKPDNIMIAPDSEAPGGERAKVLDFGIAKIISEHESDKQMATGLTQAGAVMGTPKYMSPEQCRGTGKVDFKTDVYALGVIMFEMLTGKLPFDAEGTGAMMAMHMFQPPPAIRELEPSVSPLVEMMIQSMMAKDPTARPTMVEVATKIEQMGIKSTGVLQVVMASQVSHPGLTPSHPGLTPSHPGISHPGLQAVPMEVSGPANASRPSLVGVGQTQDPTRIKQGERLKRLAIPASIGLVVSVIGLAIALRPKEPPPPPKPPVVAAAPKKVTWQITTTPPGVEVVRISDGEVIGLTPWKSEQPAGTGKLGVTLRRNGYLDSQVLLDREADCNQTVQLDPVPTNPANVENEKPGKKPGKNSRPSKKNTHDNPFAPVH